VREKNYFVEVSASLGNRRQVLLHSERLTALVSTLNSVVFERQGTCNVAFSAIHSLEHPSTLALQERTPIAMGRPHRNFRVDSAALAVAEAEGKSK
jgi:hypothetical protein